MQNIVKWEKGALKQLSRIDQRYTKTIRQKTRELMNFPNVHLDIKDLKGENNKGKYRLRVNDYRIIFEVIDGEPKIISVQSVKKRDERTYS